MAKDPAFLFYPNDWVGGTMGMSFEEKGAYMEVLMMQFNRGHMTEHMIGLSIGQIWVTIKHKFRVDENGLYYNERLDVEKEKRKTFVQSRFNNKNGINQFAKKEKKEGHMTSHMENENVNVNKNGVLNKKGIRFSENFEKVFFEDDSWQLLGNEQKLLAENGDIRPLTIIKGSIY